MAPNIQSRLPVCSRLTPGCLLDGRCELSPSPKRPVSHASCQRGRGCRPTTQARREVLASVLLSLKLMTSAHRWATARGQTHSRGPGDRWSGLPPDPGTILVPAHSPNLALQPPVDAGSAQSPSDEAPSYPGQRECVLLAATTPENAIRFSSVLTSSLVSTPVITLASGVHQLPSSCPAHVQRTPAPV